MENNRQQIPVEGTSSPMGQATQIKSFWKSGKLKVFLAVLVVGLSLFGVTVATDSNKKEDSQATPTPTVPYLERQQKKLKAIDELPLVTEKYDIEYFPSDDTFFVQIKQNPYEENRNLVLQWFRQRGVEPQNIEIEWTSVRGVY